ncbi:tripartite tricarboxylate transporter substrate binding protein [Variovorax sp. YR216]|uniref:Bug family tripartite tricarboxylate transporter substrate binding protein n=1 Tax=Variovorax sp. YR216 TaxID=1882828 RepID=UPI0008965943|nr:tripartite tricarboxylate transporter substrate binding protein [Variovorax sp. YR216]SEB14488.1 Tripartite-type tricarboxylate transporter, receptor component TctC [Variovorax sp. YR216]
MQRRQFLPLASLLLLGPTLARAQDFPKPGKPIRIIVGFAAGGPTDTQARALAQELGPILGVPVIVENRPGASGGIGAMEVARAEPDGHTLMYISDGVVTQNPHTLRSVQYDALRDFTPVARLTSGGVVLVMHPSLPAGNLQQFIAYGKANPGKLAYASFGAGTVSHIYGEVLRLATGIDIVHVPYKGSADALKDLLAGRVQIMFDSPSTAVQYVKDGRLRILGSAGTQRRSLMPDTPTLLELGLPGFEIRGWNGLFGPANMPAPVLQKLYAGVAAAAKAKTFRDMLATMAFDPVDNEPPAEFAKRVRSDYDQWGIYIRRANIRLD